MFSVEEVELVDRWSRTSYHVHRNARTCDCDLFQSLYDPCRHALEASASATIKWGIFVDPVYKMSFVFKVYEMEFSPIPDKKMWPTWYGACLKPNPVCDGRQRKDRSLLGYGIRWMSLSVQGRDTIYAEGRWKGWVSSLYHSTNAEIKELSNIKSHNSTVCPNSASLI
ncbi:hypothetical protein Ahy_A05g023060 [Arachis hypogaea]|uniref:SWIM-type domain-containing protein n=1 Tax=Arachis hypogaea TaxID=3818 RepID=A0A445D2T4_ARAHY|nr:hypothetical protein Ahy_A05g023060 [Arachis hypogaea]